MRAARLVSLTLLLGLAPAWAMAQDEAALGARYETVVTALQQRLDFAPAQQLARDWTRRQFETAVARSRKAVPAFLQAAALLHLEIATRVIDVSSGEALFHIRLGEQLLSPLATDAGVTGDFVARWSVVASSAFLARTNAPEARVALNLGIKRRPRDAGVRMAAGAVEDLASLALDADGSPAPLGNRQVAAARSRRATLLARAEREYRAAAALAPGLGSARIRLGRVLFRRAQLDEARAELESVPHAALATGERYLLLLFLADVYAGLGDVRAARTSLEEAVRVAGDRQGSWLALAQLEERDGRPERARAIVAQGVGRRRADLADEWWEYRNGRFDAEGLAWLRAAASR